jgi:hypothetical protein
MKPVENALDAEFDMLLQRAGIEPPEDRRDAIHQSFLELRAQIALVRRYAAEHLTPQAESPPDGRPAQEPE